MMRRAPFSLSSIPASIQHSMKLLRVKYVGKTQIYVQITHELRWKYLRNYIKKYVKPSRITWGIRWDNVTKAKDTREIHKANSWQIRVKYEKLHLVKITRKNTHNKSKVFTTRQPSHTHTLSQTHLPPALFSISGTSWMTLFFLYTEIHFLSTKAFLRDFSQSGWISQGKSS